MALVGSLSGSGGASNTINVTGSMIIANPGTGGAFPSFPGTDVTLFISGNIAAKPATSPDLTVRGTTVFGGDVVISGTLFGGSPLYIGSPVIFGGVGGLTGSLTQTTAGTSYLVAGTNVTVDSGSSPGQIIISSTATGGGGGGSNFFYDTAGAGKIYTTASSVAFPFNQFGVDEAADMGTDVVFYVSGSTATGIATALFSGNVVTSGSIKIAGNITGDNTTARTIFSDVTDITVGGASSIVKISGDLAVNGPTSADITTTTSAATVFNTNATTLSVGGDATTLTIGATSGNTTVRNNLIVSGDLTVNGTTVTVDATTVSIEDPVIGLGFLSGSTGRVAKGDRGLILAGDPATAPGNLAFIWDDSDTSFAAISTTHSTTSSLAAGVQVSDYRPLRASKFTMGSSFLTSSNGNVINAVAQTDIILQAAAGPPGTNGDVTFQFGSVGTSVLQVSGSGTSPNITLDIKAAPNVTTANIIPLNSTTVNFAGSATTLQMGANSSSGQTIIRSGIIKGTQSTLNLFDDTATRINFAGAATNLGIGNAGGLTVVSGSLTANGSVTLGDASGDTVTVNGTTTFVGAAVTTTLNGSGSIAGTLTVGGITSLNGSVNLGDATADDIAFQGSVSTNILPKDDKLQDLGSATKRWANIYTGDLHLRNDRGNWTIIEERDFLSITNNVTGKRYKFVLEEI